MNNNKDELIESKIVPFGTKKMRYFKIPLPKFRLKRRHFSVNKIFKSK